MNSSLANNMTSTPITRTPMGHTSYATSTRKAMRQRVDNDMQKVGMREDKEKKRYELYIALSGVFRCPVRQLPDVTFTKHITIT